MKKTILLLSLALASIIAFCAFTINVSTNYSEAVLTSAPMGNCLQLNGITVWDTNSVIQFVLSRKYLASVSPMSAVKGFVLPASYTVTNSTDTTFGYGAGLMIFDTNYVYVSVGTNLWKRAALASW